MKPQIVIRPAVIEDSRRFWEINNQPLPRAMAVNTDSIEFESHTDWYDSAIEDDDRRLSVAVLDGRIVGTLRLDQTAPTEWELTIAVDAAARGRGIGTEILAHAFQSLPDSAKRIIALVRPSNEASLRAFEKAGFAKIGRTIRSNVELNTLEKLRSSS